jgi:acyl dehydratase
MATRRLTHEELLGADGLDLGTSGWLVVGQERVDGFADVTDDHQWVHVDQDRASKGPFGTTIAHGYLTLSLIPHLLAELLSVAGEVRGTNYGLERVRFTSPVAVGSQIALGATVNRAERRADGGIAYYVGVRILVRDQDRPALVGEVVYLSYAA